MKTRKMNNYKTNRRQFYYCLSLLFILFLTGCSTRFLPIQSPDLIIADDLAIYKSEGITLTVTEQMWIKDPQFLSDHYTTFWIKVQNNTSQPYKIRPSSFALLDEDRNQMDVQDQEQVLDLMLQNETLYIDRFLMSTQSQQEILQKRQLIQKNIMLDSFSFGDILPHASKQGIIFFPKVKGNINQLVFVFNNKEITFQRIK